MINFTTLVFLIIGISGVGCALLFSAIGATVDSAGMLHEPFFLIPVGYALMLIGVVGSIFSFLLSLRRRIR
ncbi:DUF3955 domain-containing protein [Sedimentitalea sp. HM32M-2]|uniref:DUF3955 domain-containing protein n=1 Tax=Sedimentitalea sp. HM32M-2 TaxID=3351566 RepID=UPI003635D2A5